MAITVDTTTHGTVIRFRLTETDPHLVISVVGSFNDWMPGTHTLTDDGDGGLAVSVQVDGDDDVHFRYLASDGSWFDDPDADEITPTGSLIHVSAHRSGGQADGAADSYDQSPADAGLTSDGDLASGPASEPSDPDGTLG